MDGLGAGDRRSLVLLDRLLNRLVDGLLNRGGAGDRLCLVLVDWLFNRLGAGDSFCLVLVDRLLNRLGASDRFGLARGRVGLLHMAC